MRLTRTLAKSVENEGFRSWLGRFLYNQSGFRRYGLWRNDCYYVDADVREALSRLPKHVVDERNHRLLRAVQLNVERKILPRDQWTKPEDDKLYLDSYLNQVKKEKKEKSDWYKQG